MTCETPAGASEGYLELLPRSNLNMNEFRDSVSSSCHHPSFTSYDRAVPSEDDNNTDSIGLLAQLHPAWRCDA